MQVFEFQRRKLWLIMLITLGIIKTDRTEVQKDMTADITIIRTATKEENVL
jgi:hypothetical protein